MKGAFVFAHAMISEYKTIINLFVCNTNLLAYEITISVIISNMQCLNDYLSMSSLLKFAAKLQYFR